MGAVFDALLEAIRAGRPAVLSTVVAGPGVGAKVLLVEDEEPIGHLDDPDLQRVVMRDAAGSMASGVTSVRHYGPQGQTDEDAVLVFVETFAPPPRLVVFGAMDFTCALVRMAKVLGYHVTVCDARATFATRARFPQADEIVVDWPHRYLEGLQPPLGARDAVCVLTHDFKFDVPAIRAALATDVGYLGALGSRLTTEKRAVRLREDGATDAEISRVMAPIGLDIGARTPEETAVAICAEIITARTGRSGPSLRDGSGPIHRAAAGGSTGAST